MGCQLMVCKTSANYSDIIYLYNYCNTVMLPMCILLKKVNVDDSGFPEDTRQTIGVVYLPCAAIKSLKDNDRHMWAI